MKPSVGRAFLLRSTFALFTLDATLPDAASAQLPQLRPPPPNQVKLPLLQCGAAFCTEYRIDGQRFRAVVDTGSPFLLVLSERACVGGPERWGCYSDRGAIGGGVLNDESWEGFGGQDVQVDWRRGSLRLSSVRDDAASLADRRGGGRPGSWTTPNPASDIVVEPINFGVVDSYRAISGAGAIYFGLAKDRSASTRPTLLEQTEFTSLRFDFAELTLTLAKKTMIAGDAVPLVDLRTLGAPVSLYAGRVSRLVVNGQAVPLSRPCLAVVDTGTTGLVLSDSLYESDELPLPGAAMRDVVVEFTTEGGQKRSVRASRRRRSAEGGGSGTGREAVASWSSTFPFIVTEVKLPWFDRQRRGRERAELDIASSMAALAPPPQPPHVLFLGLAFLEDQRLTIDIDARRMTVAPAPSARLS